MSLDKEIDLIKHRYIYNPQAVTCGIISKFTQKVGHLQVRFESAIVEL